MKLNKKQLIFIPIFVGIILVCLLHIKTKIKIQDDIIFFQLFNRGKNEILHETSKKEGEAEIVYLKVDYENINFKNVNLLNISNKLYRKIAPGSKRRIFNYIIFKFKSKLSIKI